MFSICVQSNLNFYEVQSGVFHLSAGSHDQNATCFCCAAYISIDLIQDICCCWSCCFVHFLTNTCQFWIINGAHAFKKRISVWLRDLRTCVVYLLFYSEKTCCNWKPIESVWWFAAKFHAHIANYLCRPHWKCTMFQSGEDRSPSFEKEFRPLNHTWLAVASQEISRTAPNK